MTLETTLALKVSRIPLVGDLSACKTHHRAPLNTTRHRRTYPTRAWDKEALAVRLRKLAIDGEKTLQGVAEVAYQQSVQV